jgi:polysaccharide biosynthesis protein PslH
MRILFITQVVPFPPPVGEQLRVINLLEVLSRFASIDLVLLDVNAARRAEVSTALTQQVDSVTCLDGFNFHQGYLFKTLRPNPNELARLAELATQFQPDLIWLDYGFLAHYRLAFPNHKVIFDTHNIQSALIEQTIDLTANPLRKVKRFLSWQAAVSHEKTYFPQCDALIVVSHEDKKYYQTFIDAEKLLVVPNFIDLAHYPAIETRPKTDHLQVVFTGNMGSFQNRRAGEYLLTIWPKVARTLPKCQLTIVGKNPPAHWLELADPQIQVTGVVESMIPFLQSADLAVVPMLDGSGTRFKILEAMACGLPVVSTPLGCEGIEVKAGVNIQIAEDGESFANHMIDLLTSPHKRHTMAEKAFQLVQSDYSLEANQKKIDQLCTRLLASS